MLTAEHLVERMTGAERARAERVESVLPAVREAAVRADARAELPRENIGALRDAGLLGLVVPERFGGLGGTLRDLAGATFALGTACPSTALAFFFHCSAASRGTLAHAAVDAKAFGAGDGAIVRAFADQVLGRMAGGRWFANFASESVKKESGAVTISTEARPVDGGFALTGVKAFGCSTGVADEYLVTAKLAGTTTADGIGVFFVRPDAAGVSERGRWDAVGMRGTATHGIVLTDVFVPAAEALAVPGAFTAMMSQSRGSFVGNQLAGTAVYAGAARAIYQHTVDALTARTFEDTGRPLGTSPMLQEIIGHMAVDLETAMLWLRRQLDLETCEPPLLPKPDVVRQWRLCKGAAAEAAFRVGVAALKASGTRGTANTGPQARALRDLCMGLVQAFPAERGRLEAASMIISDRAQALFTVE